MTMDNVQMHNNCINIASSEVLYELYLVLSYFFSLFLFISLSLFHFLSYYFLVSFVMNFC
jgi:hypothetical protein